MCFLKAILDTRRVRVILDVIFTFTSKLSIRIQQQSHKSSYHLVSMLLLGSSATLRWHPGQVVPRSAIITTAIS